MIYVLLLILPRLIYVYPAYLIAVTLQFKINQNIIVKLLLYVMLTLLLYCTVYIWYSVSFIAYVIELAFIVPFLLFVFGAKYNVMKSLMNLRLINFLIFILSVISMIINFDFPFELPYIDYSPDEYAALFGRGGAKIVTILGFFGLVAEVFYDSRNRLYLYIALMNFLIPSYLLGVFCGVLALSFLYIRSFKSIVGAIAVVILVGSYAVERIYGLNNTLFFDFGIHPKIYAYYSVFSMYLSDPITIVTGTGIGQFSSAASLWASIYIRDLSSHSIPEISGFFMSYFHDRYLGNILSVADENPWAMSSSINKPYSSISTILAEFGFIMGGTCLFLFFRRIWVEIKPGLLKCAVLMFVFCILSIENWHDSPWFMFGLINLIGVINDKNITNNTGAT